MADVFEALLGSVPPDQQALIEGLRKRAAYGQLAAASGIGPLAKVGAGDAASARGEAEKIAADRMDRETLRQRGVNQEEERAFRKWQMDESGRQRGLDRALREQLAREAAAERATREKEVKGLSAAQAAVQSRFLQAQTAQLANKLETNQLVPLDKAIKAAEGVLDNPKYAKNIPGVGGIQNITTAGIGSFATHIPGIGDGAEGRKVQAAIAPLKNLILQARSGAAVTDPELQRLLTEAGLTVASTDEDFRAGFKRLKELYAQSMNNMLAGYDPAVRRAYRKQGGLAGYAPLPDEQALTVEEAQAELARRGVQ